MTITKASPFPEVDFSNYTSWEKLVLPNGEVLYIIPGHRAYTVNPAASNASGRIVIRPNPTDSINDAQQQKDLEDKAKKQAIFNQSPQGQLLPIAAGTAGTVAGIYALKDSPPKIPASVAPQSPANIAAKAPPQAQVASAAQAPAPQFSTTGDVSYPGGANYPALPDGSTNTLPPNATVQDDGSIINAETGATIGRVAQGALGAYQIYQGVQDFKDDKIGGTLGVLSGGANAATALGYSQAAPYAAPLLAAKGGYDVYNSLQNGGEGIRTAGTELGAGIGGAFFGPVGFVGGAAIGNVAGYGLDKLGLGHKTTRQRAQEATQKYINEAGDDPKALEYVNQVREQYNAPPPDPSKPWLNGTYSSFDEYKKAGLVASDIAHAEGNFDSYGVKEWGNLSQAQREAVTQANINDGNYYSEHGMVLLKDPAKAKANYDAALKGFQAGAQTGANIAAAAPPQKPGQLIATPIPPAPLVPKTPIQTIAPNTQHLVAPQLAGARMTRQQAQIAAQSGRR